MVSAIIDTIMQLHKEGRTYQEIATFTGLSRGAVAGRLKRHKAVLRGYTGNVKTIPVAKTPLPETTDGITIFELKNNTCRYIIGNSRYCGHTTQDRSFCDHHHSICYTGKGKRL